MTAAGIVNQGAAPAAPTYQRSGTVYDVVTRRILDQLDAGTVPWHRPWTSAGVPRNLTTLRPYRGVNVFVLSCLGYASPYFLTYRQAEALGGHVKRGEHGCPVVFWKWLDAPRDTDTDDGAERPERRPMLRYYTVFNAEQCEGIAVPTLVRPTFEPIAECERIVTGMPQRPAIVHAGGQAFYRPSTDTVTMPAREAFRTPAAYYSTLFHELTHSTGHASRLNRPTLTDLCPFGTTNYSKEELVAELGAAFLCGSVGIDNTTVDNSAGYIASWLRRLNDDKRMVVYAAAQAQRAADFILGASPEKGAEAE